MATIEGALSTARSTSYVFTYRSAILAGTVGGLVFCAAATWVLLSHAAQCKRSLPHSRYVNLL